MSLESLYSLITMNFSTHTDSIGLGLEKGQSAIEYLMTYGWMLLVVAIVGGAIFSVVQSQSVESVSGFSGGDVVVDDFGVTNDGNLQLILMNSAGETVEVTSIEVSGNGNTAEWSDTQSIGVGNTESVTLNSVRGGSGGASSLNVQILYDKGGLTNLGVSGSISGNFEVVSDSINYGLSADYSVNDSSPEPGDAVMFTSSSTPESEISSYSWSSPDTSLDESSGESITHVFGSEGSYEVNLTVSDGLGNSSSYSEVIDVSSSTVSAADFQLSGVSDNGPVTEGDIVNVDYSVSNDGDISGTQDIVLDVSGVQEDVNSGVSLSSSGSTSGVLEWVTESGDSGSYSYTVSTGNNSVSGSVDVNSLSGPTAVGSKNVSQPIVGDTIEFDGSGSTGGDGSIIGYEWDVDGDGDYEKNGQTVTHSYSNSGSKTVRLNVTDDNGLSSTDSFNIDSVKVPIFATTIVNTYQNTSSNLFTVEAEFENTADANDQQTVKVNLSGNMTWSETKQVQLDSGEVKLINFTGDLIEGNSTAEAWSERWEIDRTAQAYDDTSVESPGFFFVMIFLIMIMVSYMRGRRNEF